MKKRLLALTLAMVMALLAGCSSKTESPTPTGGGTQDKPSTSAPIVLRLGHNLNVGHPMDQAAHYFADTVKERTNGQIQVEVYSQSLGGEKDMTENLPMGTIDMIIVVGGNFSYYFDEFNFTSLGYLFDNMEAAERAYKSEAAQKLYDRLITEKNVRVLDPFFYYGARHVTANKPVMGPEDLAGVKLRVPPMVPQQETMEAMGAQAMSVEFTELYTALQSKVCDAQENPFNVIIDNNYDQVQDYLSLTSHIIAQAFFAMNEQKFQSLTEEQQQIILDVAAEAAERNNELMVEQENAGLDTLIERGMTVVEPDLEAFKASMEDLHAKYDQEYDGLISALKAAAKG